MLEKVDLKIDGQIDRNFDYIKQGFPSVITERQDENGKIVEKIDFEKLKQELSDQIIEGKEAYNFTWPGKKKAILEANTPTNKTLRPYREESVNFDTTENLYIEGDNLEVLKLLQNTYFKKVKMIYIDPPYNTGNDFIYEDKFMMDSEEYEEATEHRDEDRNIQFRQNKTSNPRRHSDWCSKIYPRLKLARNLLTDDGVIFISIDDNEVANMTKICNEIFGEENFVANTIWNSVNSVLKQSKLIRKEHEYILCYSKNKTLLIFNKLKNSMEFKNIDNDKNGDWFSSNAASPDQTSSKNKFAIKLPNGNLCIRNWKFTKKEYETGKINLYFNNGNVPRLKIYKKDYDEFTKIQSSILKDLGSITVGKKEIKEIFNTEYDVFDTPKPVSLIKHLLQIASNENDIIMDFFSGSATTAHAVMQLNAEEMGGGTTYFLGKMAA